MKLKSFERGITTVGKFFSLLSIFCFLCGCQARSYPVVESPKENLAVLNTSPSEDCPPLAPYSGPKRVVEIVEIRIPREDFESYQQLGEKNIGFGLAEELIQTIFDTNRFILRENKAAVLERIVAQWQATRDGIVISRDPSGAKPGLREVEFQIYATMSGFAVCEDLEENIGPLSKQSSCRTSAKVRVGIVANRNGDLVASSSRVGSTIHTRNASTFFGSTSMPFRQSAVGQATQKALQCSVSDALLKADKTDAWSESRNP